LVGELNIRRTEFFVKQENQRQHSDILSKAVGPGLKVTIKAHCRLSLEELNRCAVETKVGAKHHFLD
ncbi:MAG: hypothetical protein MUP41_01430, partial [Desulfobacterales bacterium]|nr:hypothetical protein [Desulfobacterales bacterium]